jgi:hypothetical protein
VVRDGRSAFHMPLSRALSLVPPLYSWTVSHTTSSESSEINRSSSLVVTASGRGRSGAARMTSTTSSS